MKPTVKYAVMGGASVLLLFGSFVTFAALSGVPMHKIAILKNFVKAPDASAESSAKEHPSAEPADPKATASGEQTPAEVAKTPAGKEKQALEASVGVLGAFTLPTGFSADELTDLQTELRKASKGAKERLAKVEQRERDLDDRERDLDQRYQELADLRKQLEGKELELRLRGDEIDRDVSARNARDAASWKSISKFFEEGDPAEMAKKLLSYDAKEAARILRSLDDERASAIINALPADKYHDYLEALRALTVKDGGKQP
jgi:flagellar motility protein MotE (MotC chaperone)